MSGNTPWFVVISDNRVAYRACKVAPPPAPPGYRIMTVYAPDATRAMELAEIQARARARNGTW